MRRNYAAPGCTARMMHLFLSSSPSACRDFMHVLDIDGFSSATAPAAEDQRVLSLADLFQTLQFAAAAAGASGGMPSAPAV